MKAKNDSRFVGIHPDRFLLRRWAVTERGESDYLLCIWGCWTHRGALRVARRRRRRDREQRQWDRESGLDPLRPRRVTVLDMREHPSRST